MKDNSLFANAVIGGQRLLQEQLAAAADRSVVMVFCSRMTDLAAFLRVSASNRAIFARKVHHVVVQGGVRMTSQNQIVRDDGAVALDLTAKNNKTDLDAAECVYAHCEALGVPIWTVGRDGAYHGKVSCNLFVRLKETGHPLGTYMYRKIHASMESLWAKVCATSPVARGDLPLRCDKAWFCSTFCASSGIDIPEGPVWEHCKELVVYDGLAFLCGLHVPTGLVLTQYTDEYGREVGEAALERMAEGRQEQVLATDQTEGAPPTQHMSSPKGQIQDPVFSLRLTDFSSISQQPASPLSVHTGSKMAFPCVAPPLQEERPRSPPAPTTPTTPGPVIRASRAVHPVDSAATMMPTDKMAVKHVVVGCHADFPSIRGSLTFTHVRFTCMRRVDGSLEAPMLASPPRFFDCNDRQIACVHWRWLQEDCWHDYEADGLTPGPAVPGVGGEGAEKGEKDEVDKEVDEKKDKGAKRARRAKTVLAVAAEADSEISRPPMPDRASKWGPSAIEVIFAVPSQVGSYDWTPENMPMSGNEDCDADPGEWTVTGSTPAGSGAARNWAMLDRQSHLGGRGWFASALRNQPCPRVFCQVSNATATVTVFCATIAGGS